MHTTNVEYTLAQTMQPAYVSKKRAVKLVQRQLLLCKHSQILPIPGANPLIVISHDPA